MKSCLALLAALALAPAALAKPKIAVMETAFSKRGDVASFSDAKGAGYSAIQMHSGQPDGFGRGGVDPATSLAIGDDPTVLESWKKASAQYGVDIVSLCAGSLNKCQIWDRDREAAMRIAKQTIDGCHALGVHTMLFPFFGPSKFQDSDEALHGVADFMKELLPYAKEKDVVVGIEAPVTTERVLELMELCGFPEHLKVYYDTGNLFELEDIYETIRKHAEQHFCEIHIKAAGDAVAGEGEIDLKKLAAALDASGYDKWLVYEANRHGRDPVGNRKSIEKLVSLREPAPEPDLASRPNIVWIVVDDMSCHFAYQGEELVETPNVDRLAREGVTFTKAYATAPVCSTFRSAMITGMYQTAIGAHHHRSSRGELKVHLPEGMKTVPELLRAAGYYTTNADPSGTRPGKEDYNFVYDRAALYDGVDWTKRAKGQPFFAQYQLRGGKLRNVEKWNDEAEAGLADLVTADRVTLPPYYPDHPVIREDWAQYLNSVQYTDVQVGRIIAKLKQEGVLDNTVVFFLTDHGISHARGKQFLYEEGVLIPFVVWAPGRFKAQRRDDLIAHIDMSATSLQLAGIKAPDAMQGRPLFGPAAKPRDYVVSARDRCDETVDRIRSIRQGDFKYIRNFHPQRPYLQPCAYKDKKPFMPVLRELFAAGELDEAQSLQLAETRPAEELYDLSKDPWEVHNLAGNSAHRERLSAFRELLARWVEGSNDHGRAPETEAMFDSEMAAYLSKGLRKKDPAYAAKLEANIALMKKWRAEGK